MYDVLRYKQNVNKIWCKCVVNMMFISKLWLKYKSMYDVVCCKHVNKMLCK